MRRRTATAAAAVLLSGAALAASDVPIGTWLTQDGSSKVRIAPCGSLYCATIVWVKPAVPGETNAHPTLDGRDLLGTALSRDLRRTSSGDLAGSILNPENGKSYDVTVKMKTGNALEMGGCILGGLLCGSETWTRAAEDVASIPARAASPAARPVKTAPARTLVAPPAASEPAED